MNKKTQYSGEDAKIKILKAVSTVSDLVGMTLGPKGKCVMINRKNGKPIITKDGKTVAQEISGNDEHEDTAVRVTVSASETVHDEAGDGTTSVCVMTSNLFSKTSQYLGNEGHLVSIKDGIKQGAEIALENIKNSVKQITSKEELFNVATISANNDPEVGKIVADAVFSVGKNGHVTVEESKTTETSYKLVKGLSLNKGCLSPSFINSDSKECVLTDALVLVCCSKIQSSREMLPILQQVVEHGKSLIIFCTDMENEPITVLLLNKLRGLMVVPCKIPGFGDEQKETANDIAVITGAKNFVGDIFGTELSDIKEISDLGKASKIIIKKDEVVILEGAGSKDSIEIRKNQIKTISEDSSLTAYERNKAKERLAKLSDGICIISVGATTEIELQEKKARIEDAKCAAVAALEEGVVIGGGASYIHAIPNIEKAIDNTTDNGTKVGLSIMKTALMSITKKIAENAGIEGSVVCNNILEQAKIGNKNYGYDALRNEYCNLEEKGIVDSAKVVTCVIKTSVSTALTLLHTGGIISQEDKKSDKNSNPIGMDAF